MTSQELISSAPRPAWPPRSDRPGHLLTWAALLALALHLAVLGALMVWSWGSAPVSPLPPEHLATVEVIMGSGADSDRPPQTPAAPPAKSAPAKPAPAAAPASSAPPAPAKPDSAGLPAPPPQARAAPGQPNPPPESQPETPAEAKAEATDQPAPPETWQQNALPGGLSGFAEAEGHARPAQGDKGNLPPAYPRLSHELGEQGTVVMRLHIGADGRVHDVEILSSSGYSRLDEAGRAGVADWHFTPAVRDGQPIPSEFDLTLHFSLH